MLKSNYISFCIFCTLFASLYCQDDGIRIILFTSSNTKEPFMLPLSIQDSIELKGFCKSQEFNCSNYIIVHGFQSNANSSWLYQTKDKLFEYSNYTNVFLIDWSNNDKITEYENAILRINVTSRTMTSLFKSLYNLGYFYIREDNNALNVHCIGHSLGAHVCGIFGKLMKKENLKYSRITALDPAGPCFEKYNDNNKLTKNDADYVDVIHTSKTLGYEEAFGHVDFYPNGGTLQPGCYFKQRASSLIHAVICGRDIDFDVGDNEVDNDDQMRVGEVLFVCSHGRANKYFIESIIPNQNCDFRSYECRNWDTFKKSRCYGCQTNSMGFHSKKTDKPIYFYINVNSKQPYCISNKISERKSEDYCSNKAIRSSALFKLLYLAVIFIFYHIY
jgi:hypothetical protein